MASASYNTTLQGTAFAYPSQFPSTGQTEISQYSAVQIATLQAKLNKRLGPEYLSSRPGPAGGPKLTYAEGWKVINLANEVFGFNGWCSSITNLTVDFIDTHGENPPRYNVGVHCITRVTLRDGAFHEDVGYGFIDNAKQKGAALDKCKKEAVTDALKRTLRNFGNLLGNCLYDKSYVEQVTKIKVPPARKLDANDLHRRPEFDPNLSRSDDTKPSATTTTGVTDAKVVPNTTTTVDAVPINPAPRPNTSVRANVQTASAPRPLLTASILKQDLERVPRTVDSPDRTTDMFGSEDDSFLAHIDLGMANNTSTPQQPSAPSVQPPQPPQRAQLQQQQHPQQQSPHSHAQVHISPLPVPQQRNPPQQRTTGSPPTALRPAPADSNAGLSSGSVLPRNGDLLKSVARVDAESMPPPQSVAHVRQGEKTLYPRVSFGAVTAPHPGNNGLALATAQPTGISSAKQEEANTSHPSGRFDFSNGRVRTHTGPHSSPRRSSDTAVNRNPPVRGFVAGTAFKPAVEFRERVLLQQRQQQQQPQPQQQLGGFLHAGMKRRAETMAGYGSTTERQVLGDLELDENGNPKRVRR